MPERLPVSVLVYTKNEEFDLPGCLESLQFSDDVHVFDSCSNDRTVEVAESMGARVTLRPFDTESVHRNWAMENIPFKYPWLYHSDADERVTPSLVAGMAKALADPGDKAAFRIHRRDYLMGQWLRRTAQSPINIRLFLHEKMRYERIINPVPRVDGPVGDCEGHFDHFPFSKGMSFWIERHNRYSTLEARQIVENRRNNVPFSVIKAFTCKDFHERRFHQKELFYRLPARPLVKFMLLYGLKGGFLDGRAGMTYSVLQSIYEYMIVAKVREMELQAKGVKL
ncbi:MAG: glycosyltransferase family 2 protein [Armatimonadetes bacterium]|nr:glycosyltransferase family 2 protein [Armatimonadota bacterium]